MIDRHPTLTRTLHTRRCATCKGDGCVLLSDPHGDPQLEEDAECPDCDGGEVETWEDPLLNVRRTRARHRLPFYARARARVAAITPRLP